MKTCIQNGILIGSTNWITIGIMLPAYHSASSQFVPSQEHYSAFTYWSPHSRVTSSSSSHMEKVSAFCNSSSYGSYCGVSSTPSSTKSLNSVQGPSLCCRDAMIELHLALHSFCSHSSWLSAQCMDLWRTWLFSLMIFAIKAGPISMLGPRYLPSLKWPLGYGAVSSQNITHSNYSNS